MNKEEIKFYSIGRGSLNLDGKFYYGLDYAITDFMRNLEQENKELQNKIDKAIEYIEEDDNFWIPDSYSEDKVKMIQEELKQILKDSDVDE